MIMVFSKSQLLVGRVDSFASGRRRALKLQDPLLELGTRE